MHPQWVLFAQVLSLICNERVCVKQAEVSEYVWATANYDARDDNYPGAVDYLHGCFLPAEQ